jgi:hypothetical protein
LALPYLSVFFYLLSMASTLIQGIKTAVTTLPSNTTEHERKELIQSCQELKETLENPMEKTIRISLAVSTEIRGRWIEMYIVSSDADYISFQQPINSVALLLGVDMKLFDAACATDGKPVSIDQLVSGVGADPALVGKSRLLDPLYHILPFTSHAISKRHRPDKEEKIN